MMEKRSKGLPTAKITFSLVALLLFIGVKIEQGFGHNDHDYYFYLEKGDKSKFA